MTSAELIVKLRELDPDGTMTVVSSLGDETYTVDDSDVDICSLYAVNDRGLWTTYSPAKLPGPFKVIGIA
jgi:hypothetical protein